MRSVFSTTLVLFINSRGVDSKYLVSSILSPGLVRTHQGCLNLEKDNEEAVANTPTVSIFDLKNFRASPVF